MEILEPQGTCGEEKGMETGNTTIKTKEEEMRYYIQIARTMLGAKEKQVLHPSLRKFLDESDKMCQKAEGELVSRQAVVCLIRLWQYQNPATLPLRDSE